jgi:hypothetical protein
MSRLRAIAVLLLVSSIGRPVLAQDSLIWRDSVATLGRVMQALADSLRTGDSTVVEVSRAQGLVLRASREIGSPAARTLERFLESKRLWFGPAVPSEDGFRILLRDYGDYGRGAGRLPLSLELAGLPDSDELTRVFRGVSRRVIGNPDSASSTLLFEFGKLMLASTSGSLRKWLRDPLPLHLSDQDRKLAAMYAFVIGAGASQRDCVAGSLADCAYVLGLRPTVRAGAGGGYPEFLRGDLLLTALQTGGEGAWERLRLASARMLSDQLSEAAGLPLDSLLARWRSGLLALRPTDQPFTARQAVATALWGIMLLAAALGISRWA